MTTIAKALRQQRNNEIAAYEIREAGSLMIRAANQIDEAKRMLKHTTLGDKAQLSTHLTVEEARECAKALNTLALKLDPTRQLNKYGEHIHVSDNDNDWL